MHQYTTLSHIILTLNILCEHFYFLYFQPEIFLFLIIDQADYTNNLQSNK